MHTAFVVLAVFGSLALTAGIVAAIMFVRQINKNGWNN